jgi:hypothetical protein
MQNFQFPRHFKKDPTPMPLWERKNQHKWWYGASMYGVNGDAGSPVSARQVWDSVVSLDVDAPEEYRPFWIMTRQNGNSVIEPDFLSEIAERTAAGYRVAYTLRAGSVAQLETDVIAMAAAGAMPWGVSVGNEIEFGGALTPEQFGAVLADGIDSLVAIRDTYNVKISPPSMSSFLNILTNGYGEQIEMYFSGLEDVYIKVHNYGRVQPKHWVENNFKLATQAKCGISASSVIMVEECANDFVGESALYAPDSVSGINAAEFGYAAIYAGCQEQMPVCHFLNYLTVHGFNSISDDTYGLLRRTYLQNAIENIRASGSIGGSTDLILSDPRGV